MIRVYLAGAALVVAFGAGWKVNGWRVDAELAAAREDHAETVATLEQRLDAAVSSAATESAEAIVEVRTETIEVIKEVIRYVETTPASCTLDAGWVRLHDTAAAGLSDSAGTPGAPNDRTATAGEALAVTAQNYAQCREQAEQLRGLQAYVREVTRI